MPLPFTTERFVIEATNQSQTAGSRDFNNIFALFVTFQDIFTQLSYVPLNVSMFEDSPHTVFSIYIIFSMSGYQARVAALRFRSLAPGNWRVSCDANIITVHEA